MNKKRVAIFGFILTFVLGISAAERPTRPAATRALQKPQFVHLNCTIYEPTRWRFPTCPKNSPNASKIWSSN